MQHGIEMLIGPDSLIEALVFPSGGRSFVQRSPYQRKPLQLREYPGRPPITPMRGLLPDTLTALAGHGTYPGSFPGSFPGH